MYSSEEFDAMWEWGEIRLSVGIKMGIGDGIDMGAGDGDCKGSKDGGQFRILLDCQFTSVQEQSFVAQ